MDFRNNPFLTGEFGFLLEDSQEKLPEYFEEWNYIASEMPNLVKDKTIRTMVHKMDLLDHTKLHSAAEYRLAHLQLSIIASGYVWQDGKEGVVNTLPKSVAIPLHAVSEELGIKPVLNYSTFILTNWRSSTDKASMQCMYRVPGGEEAAWFVEVSCQVEKEFAPALTHIADAIICVPELRDKDLIDHLTNIKYILQRMKLTLGTFHERLTAETFYNTMRQFLAGWGGANSPLPNGLIYEGVSDVPMKMIGGSAGQSPTLQCVDALLGIVHAPEKTRYLQELRQYMLPAHRDFIKWIEETSDVRTYVLLRDLPTLSLAFNECLWSVADFRSYHIQIVTKYIVLGRDRMKRNEDSALSIQGTGGTDTLPFLKDLRQSTFEARVHGRKKTDNTLYTNEAYLM